ncbi:hypothetical protein MSPP1_002087 [Malassezia sp. CBS 17886]|nr:hypothetical protein MSPP1_002087 [Malassezia sp. CBS 17886]
MRGAETPAGAGAARVPYTSRTLHAATDARARAADAAHSAPACVRAVHSRREELERDAATQRWRELCAAVCAQHPRLAHILCLGIGPCTQAAAQWQWAALVLLRDCLSAHTGAPVDVAVYDPQFTPEDEALVQRLDMRLLGANACGAYAVDAPTFVYMPRCPKELYEALLRANWTSEQLPRLLLCGNDLERYTYRIVPYTQRHVMDTTVAPRGALEATLQLFFSEPLAVAADAQERDTDWSYVPAQRRTPARARVEDGGEKSSG